MEEDSTVNMVLENRDTQKVDTLRKFGHFLRFNLVDIGYLGISWVCLLMIRGKSKFTNVAVY